MHVWMGVRDGSEWQGCLSTARTGVSPALVSVSEWSYHAMLSIRGLCPAPRAPCPALSNVSRFRHKCHRNCSRIEPFHHAINIFIRPAVMRWPRMYYMTLYNYSSLNRQNLIRGSQNKHNIMRSILRQFTYYQDTEYLWFQTFTFFDQSNLNKLLADPKMSPDTWKGLVNMIKMSLVAKKLKILKNISKKYFCHELNRKFPIYIRTNHKIDALYDLFRLK